VFPAQLVATVADRLVSADSEIVVMPSPGDDIAPGDAVDRIAGDLLAFRQRHGLESMVVVNLASTEPPALWSEPPADRMALDEVVASGWDACPASVVAAIAALETGCAFVDFTPAVATTVPALTAMAVERRIPFVGRDGKTGETLLKTALAPMFADRSLRVLSWAGTNLLGGGDGARLADPRYAAAKLGTKSQALEGILPYPVDTHVHIDLVPDLGEWKTAWNNIHFEGFLGTRMNLQVTWQGCDSALAAPLVLDLVRLVSAAHAAGVGGAIPALGFFFKDPVGSDEHRLAHQFAALCQWAATL
jgi:myo-inositol-1-phosphate synthase